MSLLYKCLPGHSPGANSRRLFFLFLLLLTAGLINSYAQTIQGTVYRDFNANGTKTNTTTFNEVGVKNVLVCAYKKDGTLADSTRTAADGTYSLTNVPASDTLRVEFKDFIVGDYEGPFEPTGSRTSVQFVAGGATGVDLGINYPADYCDTSNPQMVTTCFVAINAANNPPLGTRDALVGAPYNVIETSKVISHYATVNDIGSAWGLAYKRETAQLFSAAFTKRHIGFAENGPGAIFVTSIGSLDTTTTEFFNFGSVAGTDMHTDVPTALNGNGRLDSYDIPAYDAVGKVGLGDIDISDDGKTLWVTNLSNRKLYSIDIATKDTVGYAIPNPCNGESYRPFATKYYRNKVYVGVVCTRENATVKTDTAGLAATVFAFDGSTFTSVLNFPLTYLKQPSNADLTGVAMAVRWRPWVPLPYFQPDRDAGGSTILSYPEAWLTDIEFDVDGSMILGLRDRFGDQVGFQNRRPIAGNNDLVSGITPGEVLRAGACGPNGTWIIENNGSVCGSAASANQTGQNGPGGGKYYWGDRVQNGENHGVSSQAGLGLLPGSGKLAMTAIDPTDVFNTGGFKRLINSNGNKDGNATGTSPNSGGGAVLYGSDAFGYGKANGVGDLEVLCAPQPIEIGNRIWKDTDKDGIQDANEIGIDGVTVTLCDSTGATITTVVTGNGGQYYFTSAATPSNVSYVKSQIALKTNTKYILKIGGYATQTALLACDPTTANTTADNVDSDFSVDGSDLKFTLTTGGAGQNDFKADGGFIPKTGSIGDFVWKDANDNGIQDLPAEKGVAGVIVQLLNNSNNAILATDTTDINGLYGFTGLASGSYKVKIVLSSLPDTCQISPKQDAGTPNDDTNDSDFNPATGESPVIVIDVTKTGVDKDNPTIDAALFVPCVKPVAGADVELCAGSSTTVDLKDAGASEVWSKGTQPVGTSAGINASTGVVTGLSSAGDYFFILTYKGQALCSDTVKVTVNTKPNAGADITGGAAICNLVATVDLPDAANGESWSQLGSSPKAVTINASTGVVTGMDAIGVYQFILKNSITACADTVSVEVKNCAKGSIGDFVWKDVNDNGIQDLPSEKGVVGVIVQLLNSDTNAVLATDTTDASGIYSFTGLDSGNYKVKIVLSSLPDTCQITSKQDVATGGGNDTNDSDFNPTTGESPVVVINTLGTGISKDNPTIDAALVQPCIKPTWQVTSAPSCSAVAAVYSVSFSIANKNGMLKVNAGTLSGNNPYTVSNIPNGTNLIITDSLRANCEFDTTIVAPDCSCPQITVLTPNATACIGDTLPTLKIFLAGNIAGVDANWYASATGGAVLGSGLTFKPSGVIAATDTFFVELTGTVGTCQNQPRTLVIVTALDCSIDLALKKSINTKIAHIGDTLIYSVKVWNESNFGATGVEVTDSIATTVGFIANSFVASRGSAAIAGSVIKWTIGSIAANGDTVVLSYKVKATQQGVHFNTAEISKTNEKDIDSTPGNGTDGEDDIDRQCFTVPVTLCPGEKVQVNVPAKYTNVQWFKDGGNVAVATGNEILFGDAGTYTFTATNNACPAGGCCPVIIEPGDNCCPEDLCVPFTIKQTKKAGK